MNPKSLFASGRVLAPDAPVRKSLTSLAPMACFLALATTANAGTVQDSFNTNHNYAGGNVAGTIWTGVLNSANLASGDANISNSGQLTWNAIANSGWENAQANGPVLYRTVSGDFDVSVHVANMTTAFYSDGGIIARVPNVADAGPGEDYVAIRHFAAGGFDATRSTDNNITTDVNYSTFDPFLRITRTGSVFDLFTKPTATAAWQLQGGVVRTDIGAVADLQVGLWFGTFSANPGGAQFDNFSLSGPAVPEPSTWALGILGALSLAAFGRWRGATGTTPAASVIGTGLVKVFARSLFKESVSGLRNKENAQ